MYSFLLSYAGIGKTEDESAVGYDLAVLAACNHTIISRGTYSMWAAMLSGGEYFDEYGAIVPEYHLEALREAKKERMKQNQNRP